MWKWLEIDRHGWRLGSQLHMFILRPVHDTLNFFCEKTLRSEKLAISSLSASRRIIRLQSTGGDVRSRCNVGGSSARDKNRVLMVMGLDVIGEAGPGAAHPNMRAATG